MSASFRIFGSRLALKAVGQIPYSFLHFLDLTHTRKNKKADVSIGFLYLRNKEEKIIVLSIDLYDVLHEDRIFYAQPYEGHE